MDLDNLSSDSDSDSDNDSDADTIVSTPVEIENNDVAPPKLYEKEKVEDTIKV